jgi:hypothetical protein
VGFQEGRTGFEPTVTSTEDLVLKHESGSPPIKIATLATFMVQTQFLNPCNLLSAATRLPLKSGFQWHVSAAGSGPIRISLPSGIRLYNSDFLKTGVRECLHRRETCRFQETLVPMN